MKKLYLYSNQIGDTGATALAVGLKVNTVLEGLILNGNRIGDAGVTALAEALKVNTVLESLMLSDNRIGDAGALRARCASRRHAPRAGGGKSQRRNGETTKRPKKPKSSMFGCDLPGSQNSLPHQIILRRVRRRPLHFVGAVSPFSYA